MGREEGQEPRADGGQESRLTAHVGHVLERHWVPLEGLLTAEDQPVLGALIDAGGGPVLYLDLEVGLVKQVDGEIKLAPAARGVGDAPPPATTYAVLAKSSGRVGEGRYQDLIEAALTLSKRPDHERFQLVAIVGDEARTLNDEERQRIQRVGLPVAD